MALGLLVPRVFRVFDGLIDPREAVDVKLPPKLSPVSTGNLRLVEPEIHVLLGECCS